MKKKIESLTVAQEARMKEFADQWIKIGLSTEPADRPRAEAAINEMYRQAGLAPPKKIVWCGSPLSQGFVRAIILDKKLLNDVGASVWDSVGASVRASVLDSVRASVGDSVGDSVWASVWASVWDSVWDSVGASVLDSVWDSVWDSVRASVWDSVRDSVYGQHDANWLAFYRFFKDVCDLSKETKKLEGLWELSQAAGWAIPHQNICWVSERHHLLERDERGRLHSLVGPACAYPDGWSIYAVHGVRVPEYVIERPSEITVQKIEAESNTEVRRVMTQQYGYERYIRDSGSQLVHELPDNYYVKGLRSAKLWRKDRANDTPVVMVECLNSTPEPDGSIKKYMIRVDPNAYAGEASKNVHAAMASTYRNEHDHSLFFKKWQDYRPGFES